MIKNLGLRLQKLIPVYHSSVRAIQEVQAVRRVTPTKDLDIRPGVFKGSLYGFTAEFLINGHTYEVQTTSLSSDKIVDVYLSVDIDGNAIVYTI